MWWPPAARAVVGQAAVLRFVWMKSRYSLNPVLAAFLPVTDRRTSFFPGAVNTAGKGPNEANAAGAA